MEHCAHHLQVMKQIPWLWKLNRLVTSIGFCLVPMMQAYGILLVVTLVYAVLGVHLFGKQAPEYFADLSTALMTLHQAVTGDSWGSVCRKSPISLLKEPYFTLKKDLLTLCCRTLRGSLALFSL